MIIYYTYQIMEWRSVIFVILIEAGYSPEQLNWFYMNDNQLRESDQSSENLRTAEHKLEKKLKCVKWSSTLIIICILILYLLYKLT